MWKRLTTTYVIDHVLVGGKDFHFVMGDALLDRHRALVMHYAHIQLLQIQLYVGVAAAYKNMEK